MFNYLIKSRQGIFIIIGTVLMIGGFLLHRSLPVWGNIAFYLAMFFLGFYASREAIVDTFEQKKPNVDLLMIFAAVGAASIDYASEGAMLLFIFASAEMLEEYVNNKSVASISALMGQVPNTALRIEADHSTQEIRTNALQVGDHVLVPRGSQIPIDGVLVNHATLNEASLTGESIPVVKHADEEIFAGTMNEGDALELVVTKTSDETVFSNIIKMVEEAQNRPSHIARFIDTFESQYVIGVLIVVPLFILGLILLADYSFQEAFYRGMVLLTVASPCALVASATPATLSAISNGANHGVLVKGGAAMESLAKMTQLFSDKTGTLTEGEFEVVDAHFPEEYLTGLVYIEQHSTHPIAKAIVDHFTVVDTDYTSMAEVQEVPGMGMKMGALLVGKPDAFKDYANYAIIEEVADHVTTILIAHDQTVVGYVSLADRVRQESRQAVDGFTAEGVQVTMLTGDNTPVAAKVASELGIRDYHAELLPQDKIAYVQDAQSDEQVIGMIGDGINDAPALANADIGVAMGSGSAVAMESADIVMVKNDLNKLLGSFRLSKDLNSIIKMNVVFAIGVIVILIALNLFGLLDLPAGVVFHEGSTILVILNGLRLLKKNEFH